MIKSIKLYVKDYKELCKHSWNFTKKHWKGTFLISFIGGLIEYLAIFGRLNTYKFKTESTDNINNYFNDKESE